MINTKFWLSFLTLIGLCSITQVAQAQTYQPTNRIPVADQTLGTQVLGTGNNFDITGGLSKGQTLFHSFTDFSIPTNGQANFLNPVGNRDIITRVTGNLFSDINGLVNTNGANFFLINPAGIVFGNNAQLNVGKVFVGSTANSIDLVGDNGQTITFGANPNSDSPLLSVNPNVLFDVSRLNIGGGTGQISNFGTLQTTNNSQYIGLMGGNVTLDGGNIIAPGGRVDIGGLKDAGTITIDPNGLVFGGNNLARSNVLLTNGAKITVPAMESLDTINTFFNNTTSPGSSINISANNIDLLKSARESIDIPGAALYAGLEKNSIQTKPGGNINVNATGKINIDNSGIKNNLRDGASGSIGNINIQANTLDVKNNSVVVAGTSGNGNAGDINVKTTGDIQISGQDIMSNTLTTSSVSAISSNTYGSGDAGKITIDTQGKLLLLNRGSISSDVNDIAVGNSKGINITARELDIKNNSNIFANVSEKATGNSGDIKIKTTGNINISGYTLLANSADLIDLSYVSTNIYGQGDAGKITIDTQGKLSINNTGLISSVIYKTGIGSSNGVSVTAAELDLSNDSSIRTAAAQIAQIDGKGNAGDIDIKTTGNISLASSVIDSNTYGQGNAGKITIDTQGKLLVNSSGILSAINDTAVGNSKGISISARSLDLTNSSIITTGTLQTVPVDGKGNAGDITIKTTGDINIAGSNSQSVDPKNPQLSQISSSTLGYGDTGKITIDTQGKLSLTNGSGILSAIDNIGVGNSKGIDIKANALTIANNSSIFSAAAPTKNIAGKGNAGNVDIDVVKDINLSNNTSISATSNGNGTAGNISINTKNSLSLSKSSIDSVAASVGGGNIAINADNKLLLTKNSLIDTNSFSTDKSANGGNITISSPIVIATPGNNDIAANAVGGTGGNLKINSQGLFGIQYRPKGQASDITSDITASSTFGQDGIVKIDTPGTDPGKDSTELPNATTDVSTQISQVCSTSNRQNKLTVTGRGGLPPNANDPLTSDVVWQDARATSPQPVGVSSKTNLAKLAAPAVGWIFNGKGKVTLVAAATQGQPTGTSVVCPSTK
jgi:filamentous hemagglutinin family protein